MNAPSPHELTTILGDLSLAATGQTWHPQTSNATWFLMWYGGHWDRLDAADAVDELDRAHPELGVWPVPTYRDRGDGLTEQVIDHHDYATFRDGRRLVEQAGLVVANSDRIHVRAAAAPDKSACGLVLANTLTAPLHTSPRRTGIAWCVACAADVQRDISETLGWASSRRHRRERRDVDRRQPP